MENRMDEHLKWSISKPLNVILRETSSLRRFLETDQADIPFPTYLYGCQDMESFSDDYILDQVKKGLMSADSTKPSVSAGECTSIAGRYVIAEAIGSGTFGNILKIWSTETQRLYILKWQCHGDKKPGPETITDTRFDFRDKNLDLDMDPQPYGLWGETLISWYLRGAPRINQMHEAFNHLFPKMKEGWEGIVFEPLNWYTATNGAKMLGCETGFINPDGSLVEEGPLAESTRPYMMERIVRNKKTALNEIEVCKIMSQLIEAFLALEERRMTHNDVSHRNYIIDHELNAQLIDFGMAKIFLNGSVKHIDSGWLKAIENQLSPEEVAAYEKEGKLPTDKTFYADKQSRRAMETWRVGVLAYELLHGFSPFEGPESDKFCLPLAPSHYMSVQSMRKMVQRRQRLMREELYISEDLSQDCADVLRALLAKNPSERPFWGEICTFPWFSGHYLDSGYEFQRPEALGKKRLNQWDEPIQEIVPPDLELAFPRQEGEVSTNLYESLLKRMEQPSPSPSSSPEPMILG